MFFIREKGHTFAFNNYNVEKKKITKSYSSAFELAYKYFSVVTALNSIKLKPREMELLVFTSIKGTISTGGAKHEFITMYGSSMGTIGNIIHVLSKHKLIVKKDKKYIINPVLNISFEDGILLTLDLKWNQ